MSSALALPEQHLHYEAGVGAKSPVISLSVSEIADSNHRSMTSIWRIPSDILDYHATHALDQGYRQLHGDENQEEMKAILRFGHPGEYDIFKQPLRQHPFLRHLGYGHSQRTRADTLGRRVVTERFTYPTAETFNRFMDEAFGDDGGARFETYQGGSYSPEEFVEALVKHGTILLAGQYPYSAHDSSDHALGWIGFDPAAFQALRTASRAAMEDTRMHGLYKEIVDTADFVSGDIANAVVARDPLNIDLPQAYYDLQRDALWPIENGLVMLDVIDDTWEEIRISGHESASVTQDRYRQANDFAREQLTITV